MFFDSDSLVIPYVVITLIVLSKIGLERLIKKSLYEKLLLLIQFFVGYRFLVVAVLPFGFFGSGSEGQITLNQELLLKVEDLTQEIELILISFLFFFLLQNNLKLKLTQKFLVFFSAGFALFFMRVILFLTASFAGKLPSIWNVFSVVLGGLLSLIVVYLTIRIFTKETDIDFFKTIRKNNP